MTRIASGLSRRRFTSVAASSTAGFALLSGSSRGVAANRQAATPAASPAVDDLFATVSLTPGVVPTSFGDVTVPATPTRIAAITDGAVDALAALGVQPVAVTSSANGQSVAEYLASKIDPAVPYVGGWGIDLDIEKLVELKPDVILADSYLEETDDTLYEKLTAIAPVISPDLWEATDINGLQRWEYEQLIYGHAIGKTEESKQLAYDLRDRAAAIAPTLGDNAGKSVMVFRPHPDFAVVMAQRWISGVMLSWSGLTGTAFSEELEPPHSGDSVGLERLNLLDADWLFAALRNAEMAAELEVYKENPLFQALPAAQSGQIAAVSGSLWSGTIGVLAGHAMLDDIERILVRGELEATPVG